MTGKKFPNNARALEAARVIRPALTGLYLGHRPYGQVLHLQQRCAALRRLGLIDDVALFVEHPPTITQGRGTKAGHLLAPEAHLRAVGVELHTTNRGGDITLHAPGQLVGYPIVELVAERRDVRRYVQGLTEVMRQVVATAGIASGVVDGYVGLWVDPSAPTRWLGAGQANSIAKLGAIGVAISRWVTCHGFALNLTVDLNLFQLIVPCGIAEHPVTSVRALTGVALGLEHSAQIAHAALAEQLALVGAPLLDATGLDLDPLLAASDDALSARWGQLGLPVLQAASNSSVTVK